MCTCVCTRVCARACACMCMCVRVFQNPCGYGILAEVCLRVCVTVCMHVGRDGSMEEAFCVAMCGGGWGV